MSRYNLSIVTMEFLKQYPNPIILDSDLIEKAMGDLRIEDSYLTYDDINYNIVDGEEADNGIIKYHINNTHILDYVNEGGDSDWVEFTREGLEYIKPIALQIVSYIINSR